MLITAWRLTKAKYAANAISGHGALLHGGRWHPKGYRLIYCAASPALALLETLVHAERADVLRFEYAALPVRFDEILLERVAPEELPENWQAWPYPASTQAFGMQWLEQERSVVLEVPSALVPHERNYLINPRHSRFDEIAAGPAEPFPVDPRLAR